MLKKVRNYSITIVLLTILVFFAHNQAAAAGVLQGRIIILDAGHGLNNTNIYNGYNEQAAMLKFAQKIKSTLESYGATVHMTRTDQPHVPHAVRAALINKWAIQEVQSARQMKLAEAEQSSADLTAVQKLKNELNEIDKLLKIIQNIIDDPEKHSTVYMNYPYDDTYQRKIHPEWQKVFEYQNDPVVRDRFLVISLHSDAPGSPVNESANGTTAFYISNSFKDTMNYYKNYSNEERSRHFGELLLDNIDKLGIRKRKIEPESYSIIREHNVPSVLIENGFHTNPQDRAKLSDDAFLDKLASVYAETIISYFGEFESLSLPEPENTDSIKPETEQELQESSEPLELPEQLLLSTPESHLMPKSFIVYKEPSFKSDKIASFSPQTVTVYAVTENGWGLIDTFKGKYWVFIAKDSETEQNKK